MVPTVGARGPWRPAKFCAPEYHGLVEQTPLFQVLHQCCQRLIDLSTQTSMPLFQVTVSIPFESVRWISLYLVTNSSTTITGQTTFSCLKDLSYPDPTPLPGF